MLDELPAADPRAVCSRRDLRRVNAWMGNPRIMFRALRSGLDGSSRPRLVELGAGDGTFLLGVAQRLAPNCRGAMTLLLDKQDLLVPDTRRGFEQLAWNTETVASDVFDWLAQPVAEPWDAMIANLFLHHFSEAQLTRLLSQAAQRTRLFIAVEPRRWACSLLGCRLLCLLGCNAVTRHDAVLSVRAGFAGQELSRLWPAGRGWRLSEHPANLSSHLFVATWQP